MGKMVYCWALKMSEHSSSGQCCVFCMAQVADMSTQTPPLQQLSLPPLLPPLRTTSGPDAKDAQTTLYGVNAAVASSRGANGAASTTSCKLGGGLTDFMGLHPLHPICVHV